MQQAATHLMRAYARQPVNTARGSGARLWDEQGWNTWMPSPAWR